MRETWCGRRDPKVSPRFQLGNMPCQCLYGDPGRAADGFELKRGRTHRVPGGGIDKDAIEATLDVQVAIIRGKEDPLS